MGRHHFEDHTSEVKIVLQAESLWELFCEAGLALSELGEESSNEAEQAIEIVLRAHDLEALLVDWMNELIFLSEKHRLIFTRFVKRGFEEGAIDASAFGRPKRSSRSLAKAATFHGLKVVKNGECYQASIILDV